MSFEFDSEVWLGDWLVPVTVRIREDDRLRIDSVRSRGLRVEPPAVDVAFQLPEGIELKASLNRVTVRRLEDEALLEYEEQARQNRAEMRGEL